MPHLYHKLKEALPIVYIVLDLEWNGAYSHKAHGYFNEIIDIGAVKLNADLETLDTFQTVIKPSVSRKLSHIVQDLTHMEAEELESGETFERAIELFKAWIEPDEAAFLTWSQTDLLVLMENFRFFYQQNEIPFMTGYADIQRYCQQKMGVSLHQQMGLRSACEQLQIPIAEENHRALGDSLLTADVLRSVGDICSLQSVLQRTDDIFYERILFKPVVVRDIHSPLIQRDKLRFVCPVCGRRLRHKSPWTFRGHAFCADLICGSCRKEYIGRVQFKQTYDSVNIKRKLVEKTPPSGNEEKGVSHETER